MCCHGSFIYKGKINEKKKKILINIILIGKDLLKIGVRDTKVANIGDTKVHRYDTKVHNLPENGGLDQLPIRPTASNIGTTTYQLAKYLAKFSHPLIQFQCTVKTTKAFTEKIHNVSFPNG